MALTRITVAALPTLSTPNGTARNGTSFVNNFSAPGALAVSCVAAVKTASVAATFKLQVSENATTWYDVNGATFTTDTGTGTTVTTSRMIDLPIAAQAYQFSRVVATLAGAATASDDTTAADYVYVPQGKL